MDAPLPRFTLLEEPADVARLWRESARPDLWSDDVDILTAFAGPQRPPMLIRDDAGRSLLVSGSGIPGDHSIENLADTWGENVRLPTADPAWWQALAEWLRPRWAGIALSNTEAYAPLPARERSVETRYTLPAYAGIDRYLDERFRSEHRRRLRRLAPLTLRPARAEELLPDLTMWQVARHGRRANLANADLRADFLRVLDVLDRRGLARHYWVRDGDTAVAAVLGFVYGSSFVYWQDGHAPAPAIGHRVNLAVLTHCFAEGLALDWMTDTQPFKTRDWKCDSELRYSAVYLTRAHAAPAATGHPAGS